MNSRSALLAGASGLVGTELLHVLLESPVYEHVKIFVRKPLDAKHPKLEQVIVDYEELENYTIHFKVHDVYCCLGTTIKKAGSQEAFRKVDYEYPVRLANMARVHGVQNFLIVSALGADATSKVFYSKTKGEVEEQLKKLDLPALHIFQPSLLLGNRQEFRLGEKTAVVLSPIFTPFLAGRLQKYKPVSARSVANAMYATAQTNRIGTFTYPSGQIKDLSQQTLVELKR
ncbi:oxidoreductase [Planococcus sp. N028]|uniref:Oxidoreductase n=1 Tax=Planococcus shixiaomingii TaxID=3058393 RepID=A0ABT8N2C4_9BACL|nr:MULTISPECIES: oxidoreductase [unclassified Planococcus (in: firmicutes)]MDN7242036.1 oxidoreductase [Planococcus sp. N028]WKA56787.1 oxidoreductase [Planococcus sp. N022]